MSAVRVALSALCLPFALACGSEAPGQEATIRLGASVLFAGLSPRPDVFAQQRLSALEVQLADEPTDLLCLQGVWSESARDGLVAALADTFPYSLALPTDDQSGSNADAQKLGPACAGSDQAALEALLGCLVSKCSTQLGSWEGRQETRNCRPDCAGTFGQLEQSLDPHQRCRACFLRHRRAGATFHETEQRCTTLAGNPLANFGQHGMLLLSKQPLAEPALLILPSQGVQRAVLSADVVLPASGPLRVHCASLGSDGVGRLPGDPEPDEPYPGPDRDPNGGWASEHLAQVDALLALVAASGTRPRVVLGNFNASEEVQQNGDTVLAGAAPNAATRLAEELSPAWPAAKSECTLCPDNPLLPLQDEPSPVLPTWLNRVYLAGKPLPRAISSLRTHLGKVVEVPPAQLMPGASSRLVPLAPQYGYRVELEIPR